VVTDPPGRKADRLHLNQWLGWGYTNRSVVVHAQSETLRQKITNAKRAGGVAQVVQLLPCQCKTPVPPKKKPKQRL
jgi:hypothetical protein